MIKIAICDDQAECINMLKAKIVEYSVTNDIEIDVLTFLNENSLLAAKFDYHILFLDIKLDNDVDGIELGCKLRELGNKAIFILSTSLLNRHKDGYKANVFRYLEKPIASEELNEVLESAIRTIIDKPDTLEVTFKQNKYYINKSDILYIESYHRKRYVHTLQEVYPTLETFASLGDKLSNEDFAFVQKTFLVNLKYVKSLNCSVVTLSNDKEISFSRGQYEDFSKKHILYLKR